jgi:hypothetical protein
MKTIALTLATLVLALAAVAPASAAPFSHESVWGRALDNSDR